MTPFLECSQLQVAYGGRTILNDVSLSLSPGEFVALVGPNGAGKTTLLETMAGVRRSAQGEILLNGVLLTSQSTKERARQFALLGREAFGDLSLSVRSVVELGRLPHLQGWGLSTQDKEVVEICLRDQGCEHLAERLVHSLSDGERQRVQWARALCQETNGLLLDEATAHLDLAHRESIFRKARQFAEAGKAVLAIAHDLDLALRHATRIVVLDHGMIVADDSPERALSAQLLADVFSVNASIIAHEKGRSLHVQGALA